MDNAQKAIMIGVGLFITIIIISAVMLITSAGQDLMDSSMDELSNISDSLSRQLYADFAGSTLTGSEVIAAVKKYAGSDNVKIGIGTITNNSASYTTKFTSSNVGSVTSSVVSTAKYTSNVVMKDNVVTDIVFAKKQ